MIQLNILLGDEALTRYDESGDPAYTVYERLLICMRWLGWATTKEIIEALDLDEIEHHARYTRALKYFVKAGRVEQRGNGRHHEYRLSLDDIARRRADYEANTQRKCNRCSEPPVSGRASCQRHLDYEAKRRRIQRARVA